MNWQRAVPVYGVPVVNQLFKALAALAVIALVLVAYREGAGLGPASGMNDAYGWGIWKTFNVMVLTGLGSGAFAVGIAAWVFNRKKLHQVMRVAILTSFLAYAGGLTMLGVDAARPWNFYWIVLPWHWNTHSPLLEVAVCMSFYAAIPLFLEALTPVFEHLFYYFPDWRPKVSVAEAALKPLWPFIIGLAYALPMMHQSSLGALMLLGGERVYPLWQSPLLPLLYVWAAAFMGFACVGLCVLLAKLFWGRELDRDVMAEMGNITYWLIVAWTGVRVIDIVVRGKLLSAFALNHMALLFWIETAALLWAAFTVKRMATEGNARGQFNAYAVIGAVGMLYRFNPTTLAFRAKDGAFYFPSVVESVIALGFIAMMIMAYLWAVKTLAVLPASNRDWYDMAEYEKSAHPRVQLTGYATGD